MNRPARSKSRSLHPGLLKYCHWGQSLHDQWRHNGSAPCDLASAAAIRLVHHSIAHIPPQRAPVHPPSLPAIAKASDTVLIRAYSKLAKDILRPPALTLMTVHKGPQPIGRPKSLAGHNTSFAVNSTAQHNTKQNNVAHKK